MDIPMRKKAMKYPVFAVRISKDLDAKKRKLDDMGVDVPALVKPMLSDFLDQVLKEMTHEKR